MKTKDIIKQLKKYNNWRRGGKGKQPNPKHIGIAIDEAIEKIGYYKEMTKLYESLYKKSMLVLEDNKEVFNASLEELKFAGLQTQHYKTLLDEVEVLLDKKIKHNVIKAVIENGKQRADIDITIHYNELNPDFKGFNT